MKQPNIRQVHTGTFIAETAGRQIAYTTYGVPLENTYTIPVFLQHGTPGSRLGPIPRGVNLALNGLTVIALDRPGYGESSPNPGRKVADAAYDVELVADTLGIDRFAVLGRSGGGPHALACAALLGNRVTGVITLASMVPNCMPGAEAPGITQAAFGSDEAAAIDEAERLADAIRCHPKALLQHIDPGLSVTDRRVVDNATIRIQLYDSYDEAVIEGAEGWYEDILAFRKPWGFNFADIRPPCTVDIWQPADDSFTRSPKANPFTGISHATFHTARDLGHFGAFEVTLSALRALGHNEPFQPPQPKTWGVTNGL